MDKTITINNHSITITHSKKILYPKAGLTKEDITEYYKKIAPFFIPHSYNHCIVMRRYPDGINHEGFFQKETPSSFPAWIKRAPIELKKGGIQQYVLIEKAADLVYLANQTVLEFHAWLSNAKKSNYPDKIVFDLDPNDNDVNKLHKAARDIKKALESSNLTPFIMTTGSRGYHIVAPIKPTHTFDAIREFTKAIAENMVNTNPDLYTIQMSKANRGNKVFIDYLRNSYGQTSIAPYSTRALPGAPIATPIDWYELKNTDPQKYHVGNIFRRLGAKTDPWKSFNGHRKMVEL